MWIVSRPPHGWFRWRSFYCHRQACELKREIKLKRSGARICASRNLVRHHQSVVVEVYDAMHDMRAGNLLCGTIHMNLKSTQITRVYSSIKHILPLLYIPRFSMNYITLLLAQSGNNETTSRTPECYWSIIQIHTQSYLCFSRNPKVVIKFGSIDTHRLA